MHVLAVVTWNYDLVSLITHLCVSTPGLTSYLPTLLWRRDTTQSRLKVGSQIAFTGAKAKNCPVLTTNTALVAIYHWSSLFLVQCRRYCHRVIKLTISITFTECSICNFNFILHLQWHDSIHRTTASLDGYLIDEHNGPIPRIHRVQAVPAEK